MLFLINKYLKNSKNKNTGSTQEDSSLHAGDMPSPCIPGCVPVRANRGKRTASAANDTVTTTTTRASRANFAKSAASSVLPGAHGFTNHESLPGLQDAYSGFAESFPQYDGARQADVIREEEYQHLGGHVCLDYTGINLFSHAQMNPSDVASTSSAPPPQPSDLQYLQPPFFDIVYKSASLRSQVQCSDRGGGGGLEAAVRRRIMASLKIPEDEYSMVCTANRTTSLRLLAESYRFQTGSKLLTVYDYESEAVAAMSETAGRKGADVASASVAWPSLRVHAPELRKKLAAKRKGRRKTPGLFVFPLVSRMTGARYPYLWMSLARQFGWHVALDACALGNKDLETFGLSLIRPDFIVCNFFKVFGENPSGFAGLFVKKSSCDALEASLIARSIGIVRIVPARRWSLHDDYSTDIEAHSCKLNNNNNNNNDDDVDTTSSFSGPIAVPAHHSNAKAKQVDASEPSASASAWASALEIETTEAEECTKKEDTEMEIACRGLDHADALGLVLIRNRLRCITNWLVIALHKLRHPHADNGHALVRIYGPRVKFDRGPSLAFNVFDWKGEKVEPSLVQKLADRNNVSLSCGFLRNIWFSDEYDAEKNAVLERKIGDAKVPTGKKKESDLGIHVVNASLGFLTNFEDAYKLWAFVAKFLDADFVEKERWRYTALNQKTVEL